MAIGNDSTCVGSSVGKTELVQGLKKKVSLKLNKEEREKHKSRLSFVTVHPMTSQ